MNVENDQKKKKHYTDQLTPHTHEVYGPFLTRVSWKIDRRNYVTYDI